MPSTSNFLSLSATTMLGLDLTYTTLADSPDEAAVEALTAALQICDTGIRRRALSGLARRPEARCREAVLAHWNELTPAEIQSLSAQGQSFAASVRSALQGDKSDRLRGISVSGELGLSEFLPELVELAESSGDSEIDAAATATVLRLVGPIGEQVRGGGEHSGRRLAIAKRLAETVHRYERHHNIDLVDAFLLISHWRDSELLRILEEATPEQNLVFGRLEQSTAAGMTGLIAGFIRQKTIPDRVRRILRNREDTAMRDCLLDAIGTRPGEITLANARRYGIPAALAGGESRLTELNSARSAAMSHLYVAADDDPFRVLAILCGLLEGNDPELTPVAMTGLSRCEIPETDQWMRAAMVLADHDSDAVSADPNASVLQRLIWIVEQRGDAVARAVRRVLAPLTAENLLPRFRALRPRSRQRLSRVMLTIDPDAIDHVHDALRHPVMDRRIDAIVAAEALAAVDTLATAFDKIARDDHLEARLRAAAALGTASGEQTQQTLLFLAGLPDSSVKDAAVEALRNRPPA